MARPLRGRPARAPASSYARHRERVPRPGRDAAVPATSGRSGASLLEEIDKSRFARRGAARRGVGPADRTCTCSAAACSACWPASTRPWAHRGGRVPARVERLPEMLEAAIAALTGLPDRPVSLLHLDTALSPAVGRARADRRGPRRGAPPGAATATRRSWWPPLEAAATAPRRRCDGFRDDARDGGPRRARRARADWGPSCSPRKLRHTLSSDIAPDELLDAGAGATTTRCVPRCSGCHASCGRMGPGRAAPGGRAGRRGRRGALVRRVLDAIADEHRQPDELLEWCQAEVARIEEFCREHDVIGLHRRAAVDHLDAGVHARLRPRVPRLAGAARQGPASHFFITPPDDDATPEAIESYMREDNDRMLRLLCIHEGVPGHYLQLAWSNRSPSLIAHGVRQRHVRRGLGRLRRPR